MYKITIKPSKLRLKKYTAIVQDPDGDEKTVQFGQKLAEDYTIHRDSQRRDNYVQRHMTEKIKGFWAHNKANLYRPSYYSRNLTWGDTPNLRKQANFIEKQQGNVKINLQI